jgi:hypothetical protein
MVSSSLPRLGVVRAGERDARGSVIVSRAALDRPLAYPAELYVAIAADEVVSLGAFQRAAGMPESWSLVRRGSGGPEVHVGPGTVHVVLALAHPGALWPCDEKRIVNRAVRPLLRALTRAAASGGQASFFGRDWISVGHRPAAWVGFAHDAGTRRTAFEAFVAVRTPFAVTARASFSGKAPATLEEIAGHPVDSVALAEAIVTAYVSHAGGEAVVAWPWPWPSPSTSPPPELPSSLPDAVDPRGDPPWDATCDEAIGVLGAGLDAGGVLRVGGDLLVSRDAIARLEQLAAGAAEEDLGRVVDETLAAPGVALDGVRSLASVRDVLARARKA